MSLLEKGCQTTIPFQDSWRPSLAKRNAFFGVGVEPNQLLTLWASGGAPAPGQAGPAPELQRDPGKRNPRGAPAFWGNRSMIWHSSYCTSRHALPSSREGINWGENPEVLQRVYIHLFLDLLAANSARKTSPCQLQGVGGNSREVSLHK